MINRIALTSILWMWVIGISLFGQAPVRWTSGQIYEAMEKLRVLGSVLYVAAHPDDENSRLISYFANERKLNTTYLSMTRGDGGQNLLGPEIGELLGVIRTEELLQARSVDHGMQRFTRARDFGYSKTPEETLDIWNKDAVLSDVIWAIRTIKPDIIINRFMAKATPGNHGHHVASAILSVEAFDQAGDPAVLPQQLTVTTPWRPARLFFNTSWWFYGSQENFDKVDKSNMVHVNVGDYDPITGYSNTEIAALSRSMHKSQGFGVEGTRGTETEYLELLKGTMPGDDTDPLAGIDLTWHRVPGGGPIDLLLQKAEAAYDYEKPYQSVPAMLEVRKAIASLSPSIWKTRKLSETDEVIQQQMGLYLEADAAVYQVAPGDSAGLTLEIVNRSSVPATLISVESIPGGRVDTVQQDLAENSRILLHESVHIPEDQTYTSPYWLEKEGTLGLFTVDNQLLRGLPETPRAAFVNVSIRIYQDTVVYTVPLVYKDTDPVKGEVYRPFEVVPPAFVNIQSPVYIFNTEAPKSVIVTVRSATSRMKGTLRLRTPDGWHVDPAEYQVALDKPGEEAQYSFAVSPEDNAQEGRLLAEVETHGRICNQKLTEIHYDHIPTQTVLQLSASRIAHIDLKGVGRRIAYIPGAGDDVASSLQDVGYHVDIIAPKDVTSAAMLARYDAVILGIRVYNTQDRMPFIQDDLFNYVKNGGTLITQYNTTRDLQGDRLGPLPLHISHDRVTEENAQVTFLQPDDPVMNTPNKLTAADFEGWVQERGLYFPDSWDPGYTPLLSMSDTGEDPLKGSLLVAQYGKGHFVYTGLSFFRQLPDGVTGAYRLFANLIALGQNSRS